MAGTNEPTAEEKRLALVRYERLEAAWMDAGLRLKEAIGDRPFLYKGQLCRVVHGISFLQRSEVLKDEEPAPETQAP